MWGGDRSAARRTRDVLESVSTDGVIPDSQPINREAELEFPVQIAVRTGIVFWKTAELEELESFYVDEVGCELWMDQGDCRIFRFGTFLFGFCQREIAETEAILTFVLEDREAVESAYWRFPDRALDPPQENPRYPIFNFFAHDPEGRLIEFQFFTNDPDLAVLRKG